MNYKGFELVKELSRIAEETANPERANIMLNAAEEIEELLKELKELQKTIRSLEK